MQFLPRPARAAPYEKGTETGTGLASIRPVRAPRARPPMRRGLKLDTCTMPSSLVVWAARAAPYEKGTETLETAKCPLPDPARRARGPL